MWTIALLHQPLVCGQAFSGWGPVILLLVGFVTGAGLASVWLLPRTPRRARR